MGKILLLARSFPPPDGGVERRYANLCRFFPRGSVEVCTSRASGQEAFDRGERYPIHRMPIGPMRERNLTGFAHWTAWAWRRVGRGDVGLVWIGDLRPLARLGWLLRRVARVPYGISFYGWDLTSELQRPVPRGWKGALEPRIFDAASFLFANSDHIAALARQHATRVGARPLEGRLRRVRSGADLGRFRPDLDRGRCREELGLGNGTIVLTASRLIPEKGVGTALRAFAEAASRPDVTYLIAGAGRAEPDLRALAAVLGVADRVRFLGAVPYERMPLLHAAADVFVLASRSLPGWVENFPNAVLEAMASGKPVVAGRVGGVPEMVDDGETGLLVDPEDPRSIAAALRSLLEDPARARAMGAAGRVRVERELAHGHAAREIYDVMRAASRLPLPEWAEPADGTS